MSDYLSPVELFELTGRRQRPAQIAWLKANRWRHAVSDRGDPRVLRAYRDKRLLDGDTPVAEPERPNFARLFKPAA
ncbi:MAG: DUF4224 domain-containing protein [Deltaproteobacteria bacterium]|nr:DUF4224 domain-containing protein [Burkholderiales bacterium]MCC6812260.1 DUF4224 domain-containing protein [Deltaproteobacteria bacterium]